MPDLRVAMFGPSRAIVGGNERKLGGRRQIAILAALALRADQPMALDEIVEAVWADSSPSRPDVAIRSYVSNLRKIVEPGRQSGVPPSVMLTTDDGYELRLEPKAVDTSAFEMKAAEAMSAQALGEKAPAAAAFEEAMAFWRGDPLTDVPDTPFFSMHRQRLVTTRSQLVDQFRALSEGTKV